MTLSRTAIRKRGSPSMSACPHDLRQTIKINHPNAATLVLMVLIIFEYAVKQHPRYDKCSTHSRGLPIEDDASRACDASDTRSRCVVHEFQVAHDPVHLSQREACTGPAIQVLVRKSGMRSEVGAWDCKLPVQQRHRTPQRTWPMRTTRYTNFRADASEANSTARIC